MLNKVYKWMQDHWKLSLIIAIVLVVIYFVWGTIQMRADSQGQGSDVPAQTTPKRPTSSMSEDSILMKKQEDLVKRYGELPEGYLWDLDGTLLSQGDKSLSAEEVVYSYITGIRTLDFSIAQKYSRNSRVVKTYSGYFNSKNPNTDYSDAFFRNMYKQALLSLEVVGIESNSVFADNRQVFTVTVEMLDLTDKTFWEKDKDFIYQSLRVYTNEDTTKADLFLYDYILEYYKSEGASKRRVSFDITLEKYADLDTGWLVSIDTDIDNACKYSDGTPVIRYIEERYNEEGRQVYTEYEGPEVGVS
jgi:peptide methionine sulfoxide reductase MsrA